MLSKAHLHMKKQLSKISKSFKTTLLCEVKEGNKRYDFYFPTKTPIVIEVDGTNHQQTKADGFFFKTDIQLLKYIRNDLERDRLNRKGKIILFRFTDKEFPSVSEILEILGDRCIQLLNEGDDINNAFYKNERRNKQKNRFNPRGKKK